MPTQQERNAIVFFYNSGHSLQWISHFFHLSVDEVAELIEKENISPEINAAMKKFKNRHLELMNNLNNLDEVKKEAMKEIKKRNHTTFEKLVDM